jgi:SWIM zinc finger
MTQFTHSSLVLTILKHVSSDRLQRAVCGLVDGSLSVTLTRQLDCEIRALVKNGNGKEYGVTLTEALTTCSCKDSLYRGGICKHGVAVALHVLRTPQPKTADPAPQFPTFHLMWRDGIVLCGERHPGRVQVWPWTEYLLTWPEVCPSCLSTYKYPKKVLEKAA